MTSTLSQRTYTVDEYLTQEIASQDRHEYRNGEILLMPGGTPNHNRIAGNLFAFLNFGLKRQPLDVFIADQRLWIPDRRIYTYPDVMVVGQPVKLQEGRKDTVTNAIVIAEVLSQSTRSYDKDGKFAAYRSIDSFREYLLIDQYTAHVEHYTKTDGQAWLFREYDGLEPMVSLQSFEFSLSLADLYDRVDNSKAKEPLRELGKHPADDEPVNVYDGPYGPCVKHGKTNASVPSGTTVENVTLAQAVEVLAAKAATSKSKSSSKSKTSSSKSKTGTTKKKSTTSTAKKKS